MLKILADLHHEELFTSLQFLGNRLGADLYRPKGMEWFEGTMWHIATNQATAEQYLGPDTYKDFAGVSLEEAQDTKWDAIIVSHFANLQPWQAFFGRCQPDTPVILQVGNNWNYNLDCFRNADYVLNSTSTQWPNAKQHVRYHPEFKVSTGVEKKPNSVYSLCHYPTDEARRLFDALAEELPEWTFDFYGCGTQLGQLPDRERVERYAQRYGFLFQFKPGGDGYGFNIHRSWAHNTPVIMDYNHYADKMAAMCMVDRISSFDLSLGVKELSRQLRQWIDPNCPWLQVQPCDIWRMNCHPGFQWQTRLKPFFEAVL